MLSWVIIISSMHGVSNSNYHNKRTFDKLGVAEKHHLGYQGKVYSVVRYKFAFQWENSTEEPWWLANQPILSSHPRAVPLGLNSGNAAVFCHSQYQRNLIIQKLSRLSLPRSTGIKTCLSSRLGRLWMNLIPSSRLKSSESFVRPHAIVHLVQACWYPANRVRNL